MSLAELNTKNSAEAGFEVAILHPKTNLPIGIHITVLGTDSDAFRKAARKQQNRRMETMNRGKRAALTAEELEAEAIELLAVCTKGWRTGDDQRLELVAGQRSECTLENARKLYSDPGFAWLKEQVDREMGDRSNFLQA